MFKVRSDHRNANQNDPEIQPIPVRMAEIKTMGDNTCWRGCRERGVKESKRKERRRAGNGGGREGEWK
jgi:hypothetical protein